VPLTRGQKVAVLVGGLAGIGLVGYLVYKYVLPTLAPPTVPTPPTIPTPTPTPPPTPTPGPGLPAAVRSLGSVEIVQNVGFGYTGTPCIDHKIVAVYCDENWNINRFCTKTMKFQVVDSAGKGVPGVKVWLYTDPMPDPFRYKGYLTLDWGIWTAQNPLEKVTDSNGVVSVTLRYQYGLEDRFKLLAQDTGMYAKKWLCFPPLAVSTEIPYDGLEAGTWFEFTFRGGGGESPYTAINRVHCQIAGTAPTGQTYISEIAYCKFRTRWL